MGKRNAKNGWDTVAIVGVGLMGGSIGLALRQRGLARRVIGVGRRPASLRKARTIGAITRGTLDLARGVAQAGLVIVCTPVAQIAGDVRQTAESCPAGALITDVGSAKSQIVSELATGLPRGVRFVGSHPLAGSEKSGAAAATPDLLVGRNVVVTPTDETSPEALQAIEAFWISLGARVTRMSAESHDQALAATSHLPHLAASALAAATPEDVLRLVASGWLDTTRVAAGDPELWRQIFLSNREHVLCALTRYEKTLAGWRRALERGDAAGLVRILTEGKQKRDAVGS